jgi:hypothetical protein
LGYINGHFFPRSFENRKNIVCLEKFYEEYKGYNKGTENVQPFTQGQLLRNIDGIRFLGLFGEKEKLYLGSFFLGQEDIKS